MRSKFRVKTIFPFILLCLLFVAAGGNAVQARLLVFSPDEILESADLIVEGAVTAAAADENERQYAVTVNCVLKGELSGETVDLTVGRCLPHREPPEALPDEDETVLVLLRGNPEEGWRLATDLNAVALVAGGKVTELYHGSNIGLNDAAWTKDEYVKAYDAFYQANRPGKTVPAGDPEAPSGWWAAIKTWIRGILERF